MTTEIAANPRSPSSDAKCRFFITTVLFPRDQCINRLNECILSRADGCQIYQRNCNENAWGGGVRIPRLTFRVRLGGGPWRARDWNDFGLGSISAPLHGSAA